VSGHVSYLCGFGGAGALRLSADLRRGYLTKT
jgi:hypothetical protein